MDEDGFQQVRNRKNTRRNIFDIVNDDMRSSAYALAEEVRAARFRSKQRMAGHAGERQEEWQTEDQPANMVVGIRSNAEGSKDLGPAGENQNDETDPGFNMQPTKNATECDGLKEMEVDGFPQEGSGETASTLAEKTLILNRSEEEGMNTLPNEGRGDPASTMLWSPRKHAGQKRPLEPEETISDNETSEEEEALSEGSQEGVDPEEGDQRRDTTEMDHQDQGDRTDLGGELQALSGAENESRGAALTAVVGRQEAEEVAEQQGEARRLAEGERFMGRKVGGVVPRSEQDPERETENIDARRLTAGRSPNKRGRGKSGHSPITRLREKERTNRDLANINKRQEEQQQDAAEGGEKWPGEEEGKRTEEEGRGEAPGSAGASEPWEEELRGGVPHPGLKSQGDPDNGLITAMEGENRGTNSKPCDALEDVITEGENEGQGKGLTKTNYVDPPSKYRSVR